MAELEGGEEKQAGWKGKGGATSKGRLWHRRTS
jgi:hypothetical protein